MTDKEKESGNKNLKKKNENKMEIFRMKGVFAVKNNENYHLQVVRELYEIEKGATKWENIPICKIVVIGKHLNEKKLKHGFNTIFVEN